MASEYGSFPSIIDDVFTADGTAEIRGLFGFQAFDFPKPSELVRRLVQQASGGDDVVLDFFAGSAPTAHAVLTQNRTDGGARRFLCVQLPEPLPPDSEASRRGLRTIADIAKERIRRVIDMMMKSEAAQMPLERANVEDLGFRVFKLAQSNFKPWSGVEEADSEAYSAQMELHSDPLVPGWRPENLIWEITLKEGLSLNAQVQTVDGPKNTVYRVADVEKEQGMLICLDEKLDPDTPKALGMSKDDLFICRDMALDDELAANLALQCRLKTI